MRADASRNQFSVYLARREKRREREKEKRERGKKEREKRVTLSVSWFVASSRQAGRQAGRQTRRQASSRLWHSTFVEERSREHRVSVSVPV